MMLSPRPVEIVNRDCPFCDKTHNVEHHVELAQLPIKNEPVDCVIEYFLCPITTCGDGNTWSPAGMLDENLLRARDSYRIKHNLLTSSQIVGIRKKYGLTQKEMSNLFGWGDVTVSRYETTHIQDETFDEAMRLVSESPSAALEKLIKHKNSYSDKRYSDLKSHIKEMVRVDGEIERRRRDLSYRYWDFETECDANGFKLLDIDKISDVIAYFANYVNKLYKVKLMKLLWYTDVLFYNRHGHSMTGLVYQHKPRGALPLGHNEIINLQSIRVEEEETENATAFRILPLSTPKHPVFSLEEQEILSRVASKFKDVTGAEISSYMHNEEAYINTNEGDIILYSQACNITGFDY